MPLTKINNRSLTGSLITGQVPAIGGSDLPTKTVIQTKTSTLTGTVGTSSDSAVATGLTLAITPVSAGSTFILNMASGQRTWDVTSLNMVAALYISNPTGVTPVFVSWIGAIRQTNTYNGSWSCQYTHTPSYTFGNEITYHIYVRSRGGGGNVWFQYNTGGLTSPVNLRCDEIKA